MWNIYKESVGKNLSDAMEHYIGCILGLNVKEMSNKKLRLFQKDTIAFLAWCHLKRTQNKGERSAEKDTTYEKIMPALLAAYVDSSLCLSKIMSVERRLEESTTILMKVSLLLSSNTHLYLDVLLQLRCLDQSHLDLLRPLCRKCLTQKSNCDPETYTKYLVLQKKLSSLWPKELFTELLEASMILPPRNYLKWLEKVDRKALGCINIQNAKNDKKIRDELMTHQNISVLNSILNASFKTIKVLPQPAESGDSDSEDIRYLSDDEHVLKKKCDAESISSSDDDDEDVSFWNKKRDVIINDPSSSSIEASDSDDVVLMETESVHDSTSESDNINISSEKGDDEENQNSSQAIDLTCEDEENSQSSGGFVDDKISEKIESSLVEVSKSVDPINSLLTSPEPKASNLKRKYDDDDDSDGVEDEVEGSERQCKRVKLSLGLEAVVNLDIEDSKDGKRVTEEPNESKPFEDLLLINHQNQADVVMEDCNISKPIEELLPSSQEKESDILEESNVSKSVEDLLPSSHESESYVTEDCNVSKPIEELLPSSQESESNVMEDCNVTKVEELPPSIQESESNVKEDCNVAKVEELLPSSQESESNVKEDCNVTKVEELLPSSQESESDVMEHMDAGSEEASVEVAIEEKVFEDIDTSNFASTVKPYEKSEESEKEETIKISVSKEENLKDISCENILEEKIPEDFNTSSLTSLESSSEEPEESDAKESIEVLSVDDGDDSMKEDSSGNIFEEKFPDDFYTSFVTTAEGAHDKPQESEKQENIKILIDNSGSKSVFDGKASKFIDLMGDKYGSIENKCIMVNDNLSKPSFKSDEVDQLPAIDVAQVDSDAVGISSTIQTVSSQSESSIQSSTRQNPAKRIQSPTLSKSNTKSPVISKSKRHLPTGEHKKHEELLIQLPETPISSPLTNNASSAFASSQLSDLSCTSITYVHNSLEPLKDTAMQVNKISEKSSDSLEVSEIKLSTEEASRQKYSLRSFERVSKIAQPGPKTRIRKPATKDSKPSSAAEIQSRRKSNEESESSTVSSVVTLEDVTDIKTAAKEASETSQATGSSRTSSTSSKRIVQPKATSRIPRWTCKEEEPESQDNLNPAPRRSARILGKGSKN